MPLPYHQPPEDNAGGILVLRAIGPGRGDKRHHRFHINAFDTAAVRTTGVVQPGGTFDIPGDHNYTDSSNSLEPTVGWTAVNLCRVLQNFYDATWRLSCKGLYQITGAAGSRVVTRVPRPGIHGVNGIDTQPIISGLGETNYNFETVGTGRARIRLVGSSVWEQDGIPNDFVSDPTGTTQGRMVAYLVGDLLLQGYYTQVCGHDGLALASPAHATYTFDARARRELNAA